MMALMIIAATIEAPRLVEQMKRDREAEMIHRGTEYARAIKKFYKKNGRYPASLDDLDKGQVRFLRKRFKDPLAKDGKWRLLHYGDIQTLLNTGAPGTPAGALGGALNPGGAGVPGGGNTSFGSQPFGSQNLPQQFQQQQFPGQQYPGAGAGFPVNSDQGSNPEGVPANNFGSGNSPSGNNQQSGSGGDNQAGGTVFGQNSAGGNQTFGGGAIVGVASVSKDKTIRLYNKKKTYDEWQFIYNPVMDQANVLLRGPYQPITIGGSNIGTPAGQLNGQQPGAFGQPGGGFGQQPTGVGQQPGFGQQNNPLQPGNNYPPDQNQQR